MDGDEMNCKPGDLAIVIKGRNAGVLMEVLRHSHPGESQWGWEWRVKILSRATTCNLSIAMPGREGFFLDEYLRPIRPDELPEEITRELEAA